MKIIFWQPSFERIVEGLSKSNAFHGEDAGFVEILLVSPSEFDLSLINRLNNWFAAKDKKVQLSLLLQAHQFEAVGYGLLRRLQGRPWTLVLCASTDRLLRLGEQTSALTAVAKTIELAQKFRVDVDIFLTVPSECSTSTDAVRLFEFLSSNYVRRVSFGYPLLLGRMGVQPGVMTASSVPDFFAAFLEAWCTSDRGLYIEDLHRQANSLIVTRAGVSGLPHADHPAMLYVDTEHEYWNAEGPIPELKVSGRSCWNLPGADPVAESRHYCARSCEYFLVCGGAFYGAKYWFNGTLESARNPYCSMIAGPLFDYLLDPGCSVSSRQRQS